MISALIGRFYIWAVDFFSDGQYEAIQLFECQDCGEVFDEDEASLHKCYDIVFEREEPLDAA